MQRTNKSKLNVDAYCKQKLTSFVKKSYCCRRKSLPFQTGDQILRCLLMPIAKNPFLQTFSIWLCSPLVDIQESHFHQLPIYKKENLTGDARKLLTLNCKLSSVPKAFLPCVPDNTGVVDSLSTYTKYSICSPD